MKSTIKVFAFLFSFVFIFTSFGFLAWGDNGLTPDYAANLVADGSKFSLSDNANNSFIPSKPSATSYSATDFSINSVEQTSSQNKYYQFTNIDAIDYESYGKTYEWGISNRSGYKTLNSSNKFLASPEKYSYFTVDFDFSADKYLYTLTKGTRTKYVLATSEEEALKDYSNYQIADKRAAYIEYDDNAKFNQMTLFVRSYTSSFRENDGYDKVSFNFKYEANQDTGENEWSLYLSDSTDGEQKLAALPNIINEYTHVTYLVKIDAENVGASKYYIFVDGEYKAEGGVFPTGSDDTAYILPSALRFAPEGELLSEERTLYSFAIDNLAYNFYDADNSDAAYRFPTALDEYIKGDKSLPLYTVKDALYTTTDGKDGYIVSPNGQVAELNGNKYYFKEYALRDLNGGSVLMIYKSFLNASLKEGLSEFTVEAVPGVNFTLDALSSENYSLSAESSTVNEGGTKYTVTPKAKCSLIYKGVGDTVFKKVTVSAGTVFDFGHPDYTDVQASYGKNMLLFEEFQPESEWYRLAYGAWKTDSLVSGMTIEENYVFDIDTEAIIPVADVHVMYNYEIGGNFYGKIYVPSVSLEEENNTLEDSVRFDSISSYNEFEGVYVPFNKNLSVINEDGTKWVNAEIGVDTMNLTGEETVFVLFSVNYNGVQYELSYRVTIDLITYAEAVIDNYGHKSDFSGDNEAALAIALLEYINSIEAILERETNAEIEAILAEHIDCACRKEIDSYSEMKGLEEDCTAVLKAYGAYGASVKYDVNVVGINVYVPIDLVYLGDTENVLDSDLDKVYGILFSFLNENGEPVESLATSANFGVAFGSADIDEVPHYWFSLVNSELKMHNFRQPITITLKNAKGETLTYDDGNGKVSVEGKYSIEHHAIKLREKLSEDLKYANDMKATEALYKLSVACENYKYKK